MGPCVRGRAQSLDRCVAEGHRECPHVDRLRRACGPVTRFAEPDRLAVGRLALGTPPLTPFVVAERRERRRASITDEISLRNGSGFKNETGNWWKDVMGPDPQSSRSRDVAVPCLVS